MKWTMTLGTVLSLVGVALMSACGDDKSSKNDGEAKGTPWQDESLVAYADLGALSHLADVDDGGIVIDMGTPAQAKYTVGDWKSGWEGRDEKDGVTFAYAGRRGRLYFHTDDTAERTVHVRLKALGTGAMTPYINNQQIQSLFFEQKGDFQDVSFALPAEHMKKGENYLLLTFGGVTNISNKEVSVAVDHVQITKGKEAKAALAFSSLNREAKLSDGARASVVVPRAAELAYYQDIPAGAKLGFSVGLLGGEAKPSPAGESEEAKPAAPSAKVKVEVTPVGGETVTVFEGEAVNEWRHRTVDLGKFAGKIARVRFASDAGTGEVAWGTPAIVVAEREAKEAPRAKNVIVLTIDTLRASKLKPFNKDSHVKTPVFDELSKNGVVFERAQSTENWTKPSVAGILTGLHPSSHGARTQEAVLSRSATLVSEQYKTAGFKTAMFVANGYVSDKFGFDQGWDKYRNFIREGADTEAENVFKESGDWVEAHREEPFFLYVQTIDPHVPYDPPGEYLEMYDSRKDYTGVVEPRKTGPLLVEAKKNPPTVTFSESDRRRLEALHDGEITQHDVFLGKFIERLKKLGVYEDTLLVITSDHGEEFNEHGSYGHGHSVYQELLNVPLVFHMPGKIEAGRISSAVSTMDIAPTILELAGVEPIPGMEAHSLVGFMTGAMPNRPAIAFSEWLDDRRVALGNDYKFIIRGNLTASLFDLHSDPQELKQLEPEQLPIATRYLRVMQGQFLGASDRANWLSARQGRGTRIEADKVEMDDTLKGQLEALGYMH